MNESIKICECPTPHCGKSVDISITDFNKDNPIMCMCCNEQFEYKDIDQSTIRYIKKFW
jgi:hypothetical protein